MTVVKNPIYGSLQISVIYKNQLIQRQFYGYSRAGAIRKFKEELKQIKEQLKN
jgi:hypothetical protein